MAVLSRTLHVGAVAHDPNVVPAWNAMRVHMAAHGVDIETTLFATYERQIEAVFARMIDLAWNSPIAHVALERRSAGRSRPLAMRDADRDLRARVVTRAGTGVRALADLHGKRLAVGSVDAPHARIVPLHLAARAGLDASRVTVVPFDRDLGTHGDTGAGELDALDALDAGEVDAAIVSEPVWRCESEAGRLDEAAVVCVWTSPAFDHCVLDAAPDLAKDLDERLRGALFALGWEEPKHRPLLELLGAKRFVPARERGYDALRAALGASMAPDQAGDAPRSSSNLRA